MQSEDNNIEISELIAGIEEQRSKNEDQYSRFVR